MYHFMLTAHDGINVWFLMSGIVVNTIVLALFTFLRTNCQITPTCYTAIITKSSNCIEFMVLKLNIACKYE